MLNEKEVDLKYNIEKTDLSQINLNWDTAAEEALDREKLSLRSYVMENIVIRIRFKVPVALHTRIRSIT